MRQLAVINAVGLTPRLLGAMPRASAALAAHGVAPVSPLLPALTCPVQSTYLTGRLPRDHGIVANGWYARDDAEVRFWKQSNALVGGEKIWHVGKRLDPAFSCASLFWWFNMYPGTEVAVTPRPLYPIDGRKIPDLWTHPADLRRRLQDELGAFPLFQFWGPAASIASSRWIAEAAKRVQQWHAPTLSLVYVPHLDYALQRSGPASAAAAAAVGELDALLADLLAFYAEQNVRVVVLSEYGIGPVSRPVHLNRALRAAGLLAVRDELGRDMLDAGASRAFAVADHQCAHVYVRDAADLPAVAGVLRSVPGVEQVLDAAGKAAIGLDHARSGDLVVFASRDAWFTYYYWTDDARAPDFARTVDIHRKPGYDPCELHIDPGIRFPKAKIAWTLLRRKLGLRPAMDLIPIDANLVAGSHGIAPSAPDDGAMIAAAGPLPGTVAATDVQGILLREIFGPQG